MLPQPQLRTPTRWPGSVRVRRLEPAALILNANGAASVREARTRTLRKWGYRVVEASDGARILELTLEARPDLIVMNGVSGRTEQAGYHALRAHPAMRTIPIVSICSARRGNPYRFPVTSLQEPVTNKTLLAVVQLALRARTAERKQSDLKKATADQEEVCGPLGTDSLKRLSEEIAAGIKAFACGPERPMPAELESSACAQSVVHDLLSPMCTISFVSSCVMDEYGGQLGEIGREYLSLLQKSVDRMRAVVYTLFSGASGK